MTDAYSRDSPGWTESERLAALKRYDILDTPPEQVFDDIVRLLAKVFDTPMALVSLVDRDRQWFKAKVGIGVSETPVSMSVCAHVLLESDLLVIPDLSLDSRFTDNPLVTGEPNLRFYAGCPLVTQHGLPLGSLCVLSDQPRPEGISDVQASTLRVLARQVMNQLELKLALKSQQQIQQVLHNSEARHRQILESATDYAIITVDLNGLVVTWNSGAVNILGWSEEEVRAKPLRAIFTPEDCAAGVPEKEMRKSLMQGRGTDERWHQRKDGSHFWASGEMMSLKADDGSTIGFLNILRDRTTQRAAEARAHADGERLNTIINQAAVGIAQADMSGRLIVVNQRYCEMLGRSMEDMLELRMMELTHPDDLDRNLVQFDHMVRTGQPFAIEKRYFRPDGSILWVNSHFSLTRDQAGRPQSVIAVSQDITERQRVRLRQTALVQLSDSLRLLDDPVEILNASIEILARTLGIARAGYAEIDADQQSATVVCNWTDVSVGHCSGNFCLNDFGAVWIAELRAGNICFVEDVLADPRTVASAPGFLKCEIQALLHVPLIEKGNLSAFLFLHHPVPRHWQADDLTFVQDAADRIWTANERVRSQAAIRKMNETLEKQVEERTRELKGAEEALRQAHKMEAIGQLTGGIAHDFNNLLAGIIGSLELLQRRISAGRIGETQKYIDAATSSAHRAAALTHRLLAFARRQSLDVKPTDVNGLVASIEDLLRRTIGEDIAFETILKAELWPAITDANQFENALLNLVINARDAMPLGGRLTIETENVELDRLYTDTVEGLKPGDYVVASVSDTGAGMPAHVIEKAFDPFFTTKPIGQGTGLGLSMIYGFIKQSGGHIRIYSHEGKGTTVKLYLPRCYDTELKQEPAPPPSEAPRAQIGETVLVVEDDAAVRFLILEVLHELGYRSIEAHDGKSAITLIELGGRIDLLVTDVGLPGMNGRQLAEIARQYRPGLKVLFVTGYAEGAAVRGGFLAEGMQMITKPFGLEALARRIREMIEKN